MGFAFQEADGGTNNFDDLYTTTLDGPIAVGDLIVVAYGIQDTFNAITNNGTALTWNQIAATVATTELDGAFYWAIVASGQERGGSMVVTIDGNGGFIGSALSARYAPTSGDVWAPAPVVSANAASGSSTAPNSGDATADGSGQLAIACVVSNALAPPTPQSGYVERAEHANAAFHIGGNLQDRTRNATETASAAYGSAGGGGPEVYYAGVAIFKLATAAAAAHQPRRRCRNLIYR